MSGPRQAAHALLEHGEITVEGRIVGASNATLYARIELDGSAAACVYKPVAGERPLWDYPEGTLAGREVATYLLAEATGWSAVPPTVLRDGPFGPGMVQLWIDVEPDGSGAVDLVDVVPRGSAPDGWRRVLRAEDGRGRPVDLVHADDPRLRRLAVLDVVVNNGDRKGGHVLVSGDAVLGVDHGVSFARDPRLRTVLWGWAGEPLRDDETEVLRQLVGQLCPGEPLATALAQHVTRGEVAAARTRAERLLARGTLPERGPGWPSIPWPAF